MSEQSKHMARKGEASPWSQSATKAPSKWNPLAGSRKLSVNCSTQFVFVFTVIIAMLKNCPKLTLNWFCVLRFQIASMRFNMCKNLCGGEEKRRRTVLCQLSDGFSSQLEEACLVSQRFAKSRECFVFQCISVRFLIQDGVWWAGRVLSQGRPGGPRLCLLICLACACTACSFS